ncbi:two-component sensor histidine kinase, partial [Mycolicibacter senuensis]
MSSSRPAESLRAGTRRSWSLRARLLAGQVALLTVACLGIGAVTELALYQYLVSQLD